MPDLTFDYEDITVTILEEDTTNIQREIDFINGLLRFQSDEEFQNLLPELLLAFPITYV